jgi:hypothetical protein
MAPMVCIPRVDYSDWLTVMHDFFRPAGGTASTRIIAKNTLSKTHIMGKFRLFLSPAGTLKHHPQG